MNKIIEPLIPEPNHIENSEFHSLTHGYNKGFHDGAYALAAALLDSYRAGGSILEALKDYENKHARPCRGWKFETNKPKPANGKETKTNRPGHWDEKNTRWVGEQFK